MQAARISVFSLCLFSLCCIAACSTTKFVPQGEYLLDKNSLEIDGKKEVKASQLSPYIRQKPNSSIFFGWKAFLQLYSLRSRKDKGWSRFISKIGEEPVIFDAALMKRSVDNIDRQLNAMGYYCNRISDSVAFHGKKARVHYKVKLGRTYTISRFNTRIGDTALRRLYFADTANRLVRTGDRLSSLRLEEESARISNLFRTRGYYDFNENYISFLADTLAHDGQASLQMKIHNFTRGSDTTRTLLHKPYYLRRIRVYPAYNALRAQQDTAYYNRIKPLYYKGLYIYQPDKAVLRPKVIRRINLLDSGKIYNEREVNASYARFSAVRLYSGITFLFDKVSSEKDSVGLLDCTIRLTPGNAQGYKLNLEVSSNSNGLIGISPELSYYHKNIFKGGEWLNLGFMGNFQFKFKDPVHANEFGTSFSLSFPKMLFLKPFNPKHTTHVPRTDLSASVNYQKRPEYTRIMGSMAFGYNFRVGERMYFTVNPVQLNLVKLYNRSDDFFDSLADPFIMDTYRDHLDLGGSCDFLYTTDASAVHKRNYFSLRAGLDLSGNLLSLFNRYMGLDTTGTAHTIGKISYSQYAKADANAVYTWIFNKHSLAARLYAGIGVPYGNSGSLPLEQQFYSGGANSLRAWQARTIGPGSMPPDTTFRIPNQHGDIKLEANLEYRFSMFWKIEGAIFADAGNIWTLPKSRKPGRPADVCNREGSFHFKSFARSIGMDAGIGIRLNMDFVILRLDGALVLRDPVEKAWIGPSRWFSEKRWAIQFGVGYPF